MAVKVAKMISWFVNTTYVKDRFPSHVCFRENVFIKCRNISFNKLCDGFNILGCNSSS